jgi:DNA mismatch repair protein MutL
LILHGICLGIKNDTEASRAQATGQGSSLLSRNAPAWGGVPILLVGQIASAYLVAEGPDGLYLIDQHAAHERILFESFMALWASFNPNSEQSISSRIPAQALLHPVTVDLPPASARLIEEQLPVLKRMGFEVELFGKGSFLVRAIPSLLVGLDPSAALGVILEDFEEDETPLQAEADSPINRPGMQASGNQSRADPDDGRTKSITQ